ncbi:hypothetical protein Tco_0609151, partial [Tanacetum coccineum]
VSLAYVVCDNPGDDDTALPSGASGADGSNGVDGSNTSEASKNRAMTLALSTKKKLGFKMANAKN